MKCTSFPFRFCCRSGIRLFLVGVFFVGSITGNSEAAVLDSEGTPVRLPTILRANEDKGSACWNNADLWQEWITHKVGQIDSRYEKVAETLKKVSQEFSCDDKRIDWQGALIQSILETGYFRFQGDADPGNYNIGGVGITLDQRDETGKNVSIKENFGSLERGIKAYFQHLCLYASGYELEDPLAARTRVNQKLIAEKVQKLRTKYKNQPITFNDLKGSTAPWVIMDKSSEKFKNFAKHYAPPGKDNPSDQDIINAWKKYMKKVDNTGGFTLEWAGDPFYGVKMMSLWADGTKWLDDHCDETGGGQKESPNSYLGLWTYDYWHKVQKKWVKLKNTLHITQTGSVQIKAGSTTFIGQFDGKEFTGQWMSNSSSSFYACKEKRKGFYGWGEFNWKIMDAIPDTLPPGHSTVEPGTKVGVGSWNYCGLEGDQGKGSRWWWGPFDMILIHSE